MSALGGARDTRDERELLTARMLAAISAAGLTAPSPGASWDALALEVFRFQHRAIPAYGRWCESRGVGPEQVETPWQIPAVPTEAFKHLLLFAGEAGDATRIFRTSGTSRASERGAAYFTPPGLALMDAAIDVRARQMLFPDLERARFLVLAPPPESDPERIMSYGIRRLVETFGRGDGSFFVGPTGLDLEAATDAILVAARANVPVTIAGATSALAAVLGCLSSRGAPAELPAGSRVMHAGGRKRDMDPVDAGLLREQVARSLGIPPELCVNLLGMTELASQLYDDTIRARTAGEPARRGKVPPPWCRTWVTDPDSREPLPPGELGLLRHLDLANVERPVCVQTDDLGVTFPDGSFEILGRAAGAQARGCALDVEEWRTSEAP